MKKILLWVKSSLPVVLIFLGILTFALAQSIKFHSSGLGFSQYFDDKWPDYLAELGNAILISGIAGIFLHTFQFIGVFTTELRKVISHPEYIRNRADLPEYWETVTKELLKHKFPKINKAIMADVKNGYLPIESDNYYDKFWQLIAIKLVDRNKELVEVTQTTKYTIVLADKNVPYVQQYVNTIITGNNGSSDASFDIKSYIVNGKEMKIEPDRKEEKGKLISTYGVTLSGSETYDLEVVIKKRYCLKHDNVIYQVNRLIRNNFVLKFQLDGVSIDFQEIGTLNDFKTNANNDRLIEKEYVGLLYPRQGYMAIIKKK